MSESKKRKTRSDRDHRTAGDRATRSIRRSRKRIPLVRDFEADARNKKSASLKRSPLCPVFGECGGCDLLDIPYEKQLEQKDRRIRDLFIDVADEQAFLPIIGMERPFHYRNKIATPFVYGFVEKKPFSCADSGSAAVRGAKGKVGHAKTRKGDVAYGGERRIISGMYAAGSHRVIQNDECILENEIGQRVIFAVKRIMERHGIEPYDEDKGTGFLRHAVVRVGHSSEEVLVTLVTNSKEFPYAKSFCKELIKSVPEITTIVQNVNLSQTNAILGSHEHTLYGPGFILDRLCGLSIRISSHSFYQVNSKQTEVLYRKALDLADLCDDDTMIDAYCGTGTIGLVAAARGIGKVIGVDNIPSAIDDARLNARHNGVKNADFICADAGDFLRHVAVMGAFSRSDAEASGDAIMSGFRATVFSDLNEKNIVLMMDPPRAGCTEDFLEATCRLAPRKIVYISCNPDTQHRDVKTLVDKAGYNVDALVAVDMFPHTKHIENICLMTL